MSKNVVIILMILTILIVSSMVNSHVFNHLPWDSSISFKKNITPYLVVLVVCFACYTTISTVFTALGIQDKSKHSARDIGQITNIQYSSIRVNNTPRFDVTVSYKGIEKTFKAQDEAIQFHFNVGDDVVVYYDPENPRDSHLTLVESGKIKVSESSFQATANFKISTITPTEKLNVYELFGELFQEEKVPQTAKFCIEINPSQVSTYVPGMIIPCNIDTDSNGELEIQFQTKPS